ncbi:MAG: hypothetical protein Q9201_005193 [Fulgogasparrea decipioides]
MGTKDVKDTELAAAALAVALVALAIAITQLCGQLFATADGYRRCQPSVMGAWAQHTRLRWKWSEMRFETLFTTPEIFLMKHTPCTEAMLDHYPKDQTLKWVGDSSGVGSLSENSGIKVLLTTIEPLDEKFVDPGLSTGSYHEMACWLPFLQELREEELHRSRMTSTERDVHYRFLRRPACRPVQRSWDFMAPDLVRPLAVTYVGDIAVIVQRLGMKWHTFRPEEGEMRAEGNGHVIYSTLVRSIGPILHYAHEQTHGVPYSKDGPQSFGELQNDLRFIPTHEVDMMRFGILPCDSDLIYRKRFVIGTFDEVRATLDILDPTGAASKKVRDNRQFESTATFGFSDLISMAAPMLRPKGSFMVSLPVPTEHASGLTTCKEGFVVFRQRLSEYIHTESGGSRSPSWVLEMYDSLKVKYPYWENGFDANVPYLPDGHEFLDQVHDIWAQTTDYFQELHASLVVWMQDRFGHLPLPDMFDYEALMACHIKHAVNFWHEAHARIANNEVRDHHGLTDWLAEGMHLYWDYLPKIVSEMAPKTKASEATIREAWIMLMFRAFCWSRCHYVGPPYARYPESSRLPSRYWNSKLPVYMG